MNFEVPLSLGGNAANRSEDALIQKQNTVLLFDADPAVGQLVSGLLEAHRLGTLCVIQHPREAEEIIESERTPSLFLVHLDGPEDPRLNWLREQLKNAAWQRLSVILLTASDPRPLWREALALNLTDVLAKPLDESALLLKLRQCLGLRIYRDRLLRQDLLTGLTNHSGFMRRLESVLRSTPRACTLMLLDLDRFRQLNDGLGHAIGDAFLKAVSQRLDDLVFKLIENNKYFQRYQVFDKNIRWEFN